MASLGHIAIGLGAGRLYSSGKRRLPKAMLIFSALAMLPDADVLAFGLHIPYGAPWGHRGAGHSLLGAAFIGFLAYAT